MKRIIAREWLYLLGFAVFGGVVRLGSGWLRPMELIPHSAYRSDSAADSGKTVQEYLDSELIAEYQSLGLKQQQWDSAYRDGSLVLSTATDSLLLEIVRTDEVRDSLFRTAKELERKEDDRRVAGNRRRQVMDAISDAALIFPYPLFLLLRFTLWSWRQIRKQA